MSAPPTLLAEILSTKTSEAELQLLKSRTSLCTYLPPGVWTDLQRAHQLATPRELTSRVESHESDHGPNRGVLWCVDSTAWHEYERIDFQWLQGWGYALWDEERLQSRGVLGDDAVDLRRKWHAKRWPIVGSGHGNLADASATAVSSQGQSDEVRRASKRRR